MAKKKLNRKKLNPSIPIFTGTKYTEKIGVQLFQYNADTFTEKINYSETKFKGFNKDNNQYWLNLHGIHDVAQITDFCNKIGLHALTIQDILDVNQRSKFQDFEKLLVFFSQIYSSFKRY